MSNETSPTDMSDSEAVRGNGVRDTVLVTGSTAIDQTGYYDGSFETYQSQYRINALNMSFQLGRLQTSFGGCAPNIAYGLTRLGVPVIPLSSAGRNFRDRYQAHLESAGISTDYIAIDESVENCASCMMVNDNHGNQIIAFYPGPGAELRSLPSQIPAINRVGLAILGPEEPDLTLRQARDLAPLDIPIMFDPGQVVTAFEAAHITEMLEIADVLIVNDYERSVMCANTGLQPADIESLVTEVVVTHGGKGVEVISRGQRTRVAAVPDVKIVDVTGSGDAFRAGYAYGVLKGLGARQRAEIGCILAALNLGGPHTQTYDANLDQVLNIQRQVYGD
ncbi:MAG: carbohydrate kinase family protein [Proteobacteria bacterium]|nr:carbohydrate kinase family protein [Pseudomonadota bacterium]